MTAEPVPATRTVVLERAGRPEGHWPSGYWVGLIGCGIRMPVGVWEGRTFEGLLVAALEGEDEITLTFEGVAPEASS